MKVDEIEKAISALAPPEFAELARWFEEYQEQVWDREIERDFQQGRLDALIAEANKEFEAR